MMKETNIDCANKFNPISYPGTGFFRNTDEYSNVEYMLNDGMSVIAIYESQYLIIKDFFLSESDNKEDQNNKVSEDFALKAMAMMVNKESFKDIK